MHIEPVVLLRARQAEDVSALFIFGRGWPGDMRESHGDELTDDGREGPLQTAGSSWLLFVPRDD